MTNNLEDFEQPDHEPENGLPQPPRGMRANLSHAWRTRPLFKLLVIMIVAGAIIAISITLFSPGPATELTHLAPPPPGMHEPAGGPASPYFNRQTEEANAQRAKDALNNGSSAISTPIGQATNVDEAAAEKNRKDPLIELRAEVERQRQQITQMQQQPQQQKPPEQFDDSLAQAMQQQMKQLMDSWLPHGIKAVSVTKDDDASKTAAAAPTTPTPSMQQPKTIVPAGTVSYAQLLTEANSDVPGPILAQIMSGPLAGARAVGEFRTMDDYLVLHFALVNFKGKDYQIDAIALDPDTTLGGMATDVDQRYFTRVILPAAAGFMQGLGSALGQGSSSIVTNGTTTIVQQSGKGIQQGAFQGVAQAGQSLSQFFQNEANTVKPLVKVAAGTPMGLFFVATVTDQTYGQYPYGQMPGMSGMPGSGYGGFGYSPYGGQSGAQPNGAANVPYPQAAGMSYPGTSYGTTPYGSTPYGSMPYGTTPYNYNTGAAPTYIAPTYTTLPNGTIVGNTPNSGIGTTVITH